MGQLLLLWMGRWAILATGLLGVTVLGWWISHHLPLSGSVLRGSLLDTGHALHWKENLPGRKEETGMWFIDYLESSKSASNSLHIFACCLCLVHLIKWESGSQEAKDKVGRFWHLLELLNPSIPNPMIFSQHAEVIRRWLREKNNNNRSINFAPSKNRNTSPMCQGACDHCFYGQRKVFAQALSKGKLTCFFLGPLLCKVQDPCRV